MDELVFRIVPEDNGCETQLRGGEANAIGHTSSIRLPDHPGVETADLSKLAEEAAAELDEKKRERLHAEIQDLVAKQRNAIVLNYEPQVLAMQDSVAGLGLSPIGIPWLMRTGFTS